VIAADQLFNFSKFDPAVLNNLDEAVAEYIPVDELKEIMYCCRNPVTFLEFWATA